MRLGEKITWTPSAFDHEVSGQRADKQRKLRTVTGRIAYIHPARRYTWRKPKWAMRPSGNVSR